MPLPHNQTVSLMSLAMERWGVPTNTLDPTVIDFRQILTFWKHANASLPDKHYEYDS
jgi:hypothetical protein